MNGKSKCNLLKSIRCQIAKKNNIEYSVTECTFQGECKGTCPKCEAELQYLAKELEKIKRTGKRVAVAGIAAAVVAAAVTGCTPKDQTDSTASSDEKWAVEDTAGMLAIPNEEENTDTGELVEGESETPDELEGDIAIVEDWPEDPAENRYE